MIKLLLCLACGFAIALTVLQLRQQRLDLDYQASELHDQINAQQSQLWSQQVNIARFTAPNAIQNTIKGHGFAMVSESPLPASHANWIDPTPDRPRHR